MKLASYDDGSRDGQLIVVSRDLSTAHYATAIAARLQQALDDWGFIAPQLEDLYATLNQGKARHAFAFEPAKCLAPLPRAFVLDWSGATGAGLRAGDGLARATARLTVADAAREVAAEAGFAALLGDIAAASPAPSALDGVRLLALCAELAPCADGAPWAPLASVFGPVAVTPDELGPAWQRGRVALELDLACDGTPVAPPGDGMAPAPGLGDRIARLCQARPVRAGAIVAQGAAAAQRCRVGSRLRVDAHDADRQSVFGAIDAAIESA